LDGNYSSNNMNAKLWKVAAFTLLCVIVLFSADHILIKQLAKHGSIYGGSDTKTVSDARGRQDMNAGIDESGADETPVDERMLVANKTTVASTGVVTKTVGGEKTKEAIRGSSLEFIAEYSDIIRSKVNGFFCQCIFT
jgi:hypothetical protein